MTPTYEIEDANPPQQAIGRRPRRRGPEDIHQIQIHATRGASSMKWQAQGTVNWFADDDPYPNGSNHGTWASSADFVIGPAEDGSGRTRVIRFGNWQDTYGSWSAGFGELGSSHEYGAAEYGVAIELAQPLKRNADGTWAWTGDSDVAYTEGTLDALAWLAGEINQGLVDSGLQPIPAVRIPSWDQRNNRAIPRGWIGHEDLANGVRGGKSDPGAMFPWDDVLKRLNGEPDAQKALLELREAREAAELTLQHIDRAEAALLEGG